MDDWMTPENRLSKAEFDNHCRAGDFVDGPHVSTFGDGPHDPYNPDREAWGTLKDGRRVWAYVCGAPEKQGNDDGK